MAVKKKLESKRAGVTWTPWYYSRVKRSKINNAKLFYCFTVHGNSLNVTHQLMHFKYNNIFLKC